MISINDKRWDKLQTSDIVDFLQRIDEENFFFEFKSDDISPKHLMKEISALANTYGGYLFLGVNDDKSIGGCKKWTENRIHNSIHDLISPIPNFDVRKFQHKGAIFFVIKIEEGTTPPYITNDGEIYERISSGSYKIQEASTLLQLYKKREDQEHHIQKTIELPEIRMDNAFPLNILGYIDFGFFIECSELSRLQRNFYNIDLTEITNYLNKQSRAYSISKVGHSYLFALGEVSVQDPNSKQVRLPAGTHNFMEVMANGSIRLRIILNSDPEDSIVDITPIVYGVGIVFKDIYNMLMGDMLSKIFIYAKKYEKLTVIKQFTSKYKLFEKVRKEEHNLFLENYTQKYKNSTIIVSDRVPKDSYLTIDKRYFSNNHIKYNNESLIEELFHSEYFDLGYIKQYHKNETQEAIQS